MNWDQVKGEWKQIRGKVKEKWGKLTDDDLDVIEGEARTTRGSSARTLWTGQRSGGKGSRRVLPYLLNGFISPLD